MTDQQIAQVKEKKRIEFNQILWQRAEQLRQQRSDVDKSRRL